MSTRSTIALLNKDGTVSQVYCHFDGYLSNNGRLLNENYGYDETEALLKFGDMSGLGADLDDCVFYGRDRGETGTEARVFKDYDEYMSECDWEEYNYIFRDGEWFYEQGDNSGWKQLVKDIDLEAE